MNVKEAEAIIHSLSEPGKMPGYGYALPNWACETGSKLAKIDGSVCSVCYAGRGHYCWGPVQRAMEARLKAIDHPQWAEAMVVALKNKESRYFRWHDSGDLQSLKHLKNIVKIAIHVPDMNFWLPTKETTTLIKYFGSKKEIPANLVIRLSSSLIDSAPPNVERFRGQVQTCSVHWKKPPIGVVCPAPKQDGKCGTCRKCWDNTIANVSYKRH